MTKYTSRYCDCCERLVAVKYFIRWTTVYNYVTIRGDEVTTYVNYEDNTTPVKFYYCKDCWNKIVKAISNEICTNQENEYAE
ncbi:MAG: hypothetical protein IKL53_10260 [Lachnospiraceae bacterium]|nr:hypothetical protein [Lachnospiraceae bacterium]